ncbi:MAG: sigma factor [Pirellulales bacterium]
MSVDAIRAEIVSEYTQRLIRLKARQLSRRRDFRRADLDDLVQELTLRIWEQAERFDAKRSCPRTFIQCILGSAVGMIVRHRRRQVRLAPPGTQVLSLALAIRHRSDSEVELATLISHDDLARRTGVCSQSPLELFERQADVETAITSLPAQLQPICRQLMHHRPAKVAQSLGVSRFKVGKAITAIRRHFTRLGLCQETCELFGHLAPSRHI